MNPSYMIYRQIATMAGIYCMLNVCVPTAFAQNNVGIGTTQPNPHAVLQLVSPNSNQGFLIPSLTTAQRNGMTELTASDNGLMVFDLEEKTFYYWNDDRWVSMIGNSKAGGDLVGSYPEPQLREGAVTTEKLAQGAINSDKIQDASIGVNDISPTRNNSFLITTQGGSVFWETLDILERSDLPIGNIYVGTQSGEASFLPVQGDGFILIGNGTSLTSVRTRGDVTFKGSDGYGDVQIVADAVTGEEIAANAVGSSEIQDSTIVNLDVSATAAISGTKIVPDFGTQNIVTTGKATSAATDDTDAATTLTTKGYVDGEISAISNNLEDGNGMADFTYNGTAPATVSINNGAGLDFDANAALQIADDGVTAAKVNADVAGDGIIRNATNGALQLDFNDIAREVASVTNNDLLAIYDAEGAAMARISWQNVQGSISANNISEGILGIEHLPNVGLGTTTLGTAGSPIETIQLDTKGRVAGITSGASPSDRRLKKDIQPLENALQKLMQLQGYQYYWKDMQKDSAQQIGVVAQELEKVYPALVKMRSDGYKGVNYDGLIPVLIEAIKEQQKIISTLQTQRNASSAKATAALQQENQSIRAELDMIKKALGLDQALLNAKPAGENEEMER